MHNWKPPVKQQSHMHGWSYNSCSHKTSLRGGLDGQLQCRWRCVHFVILSDSFSKKYGNLAVLSAKILPVSGAVHVPMYFTGLRSYIRVQLHTGNFRSLGNHNTYCCSNHCRSDRKSCFDTPQRCPFIASFLKVKLCCDVSVCNQHVFSPTNNL